MFYICLSLLFLTACNSVTTKPMDFPQNDGQKGPGLFTGDKGYFDILPPKRDTVSHSEAQSENPQSSNLPEKKILPSAPGTHKSERTSLDYQASL